MITAFGYIELCTLSIFCLFFCSKSIYSKGDRTHANETICFSVLLTANGVRKLSYITEIARYTPLEVTLFLPSHVVELFLD